MKLNRKTALALVIVITLVGFGLRLHKLGSVPLRGDEAFSAQYWAGLPLSQSLTTIATLEPHPVLTYAIFRAWGRLIGSREFPLRALPALANLLGIPALYALGKRLGGRWMGIVAALIWAVNPFEIWHAQDLRNYGIWAGASAVALWLGYRALQRNRRLDWILYAVGAAIAANIYYNEWLTMAAFVLFALVTHWKNWRLLRRLLLAQAPAIITSILSFLILQWSLILHGGYGGTTGKFDPTRLPFFLTTLTFSKDLPADFTAALWPIILLILLVGLWRVGRRDRDKAIFLGLMGFVPLLLLCILSLKLNIFAPHYVLSTVPAYILILAYPSPPPPPRVQRGGEIQIGLSRSYLSKIRQFASIGIVGLWLIGAGYTLRNYFDDPAYIKSPNWPAAMGYVRQYVTADDLAIQLSVDPAFGYYYDLPALNIALPSYPSQSRDDIQARLQEYTIGRKSVWLMGQTFPDWPNYGVVEGWMNDHFQSVLKTQVSGLHVEQFMPWTVSDDEVETIPLTTFGNVVDLMGVDVLYPPEVTRDLTVLLYWRAKNQSDAPLKVFVHLGDNPILAQDDHFPQDGFISTDHWQVGTVYRDVYHLPLTTPLPAGYELDIGFYNPDSGERITTNDGQDSYQHGVMRLILPR
ncbi:MAG: glycosyltransferase family 39 protein [Chloroflexota bacterium]